MDPADRPPLAYAMQLPLKLCWVIIALFDTFLILTAQLLVWVIR